MSENNFGYDAMFAIKTESRPTDAQIDELAEFMARNVPQVNSKVPAGYTYLGQFIDHDIALDSEVGKPPWEPISLTNTRNLRTPFFDLETLYGDTPSNPNELVRKNFLADGSASLLKLGATIKEEVTEEFQNDLPRFENSPKAQIVDERNDENLAVAQTQVALIKFHNAVAAHIVGGADISERFEKARTITTHCYQRMILDDFLPKIIKRDVLETVLEENRFYRPQLDNVFMPLEFSVAAYRTGHSMVRDSYNWNRIFNDDVNAIFRASLANLSLFTGSRGLGGFNHGRKHLPSDWLINWNQFFDIDDSSKQEKFNFAKKIDTTISSSLGFLNPGVSTYTRKTSLPAMDLFRTRALDLPTGQEISDKINGRQSLKSDQIADLLPDNLKGEFSKNTPLWFYLLAEAEINEGGETLGEIGSQIIAETFVGLLRIDEFSVLNNDFSPDKELTNEKGFFGMPEMLKFIAKHNKGFLNPIGD